MPSRNTTTAEAKLLMLRISEMYKRAMTQEQMAQKLGIERGLVYYYLRKIREMWAKEMVENIDKAKAVELQKIDNIERMARKAFANSLLDAQKETVEELVNKAWAEGESESGADDGIQPAEVRKRKEKAGRTGDPRYLERISWCVEQRLKIMGAYAPTKTAFTNPEGDKPFVLKLENATEEELLIFDRIVSKNRRSNRIGTTPSQN